MKLTFASDHQRWWGHFTHAAEGIPPSSPVPPHLAWIVEEGDSSDRAGHAGQSGSPTEEE